MSPLAAVLLTAVLSSLLTVGLVLVLAGRVMRRIEMQVERRLREELDHTARIVGEELEARLQKVISDAVAELKRSSLAGAASRSVAATGAELMQEGLRILMGGPPKV
jgi:sensor domain CHASE-containing protein